MTMSLDSAGPAGNGAAVGSAARDATTRRTRASGTDRTRSRRSFRRTPRRPSRWRTSAPAPVASTSGNTPMMNAMDVITIGRKRSRRLRAPPPPVAPCSCRCLRELDDQDGVLAREADEHEEADLREDVVVAALELDARRAPASSDIGTIRMMASGSEKLSYCAASTRNTNSTHSGKTNSAALPASICWNARSVHSKRHAVRQRSRRGSSRSPPAPGPSCDPATDRR